MSCFNGGVTTNWAVILAEAGLCLKTTFGRPERPKTAFFGSFSLFGRVGEGLRPPQTQLIPDFYCMATLAMLKSTLVTPLRDNNLKGPKL